MTNPHSPPPPSVRATNILTTLSRGIPPGRVFTLVCRSLDGSSPPSIITDDPQPEITASILRRHVSGDST